MSLNPNEIDAVKRSLNSTIDALKVQVRNGANGNSLGYLKQLKSAFEEDVYEFYGKVGDAEAAANAKQLSSEYARIVQDQTKGPAKDLLKSAKPEQIVSRIANANSQSAVESLSRNMSPDGMEMLRDSVTKDIYRRNALPSGEIDMQKVQQHFAKMGEAAESLYGDRYPDVKAFVDSAADLQQWKAANPAMSWKAKVGSQVVRHAAGALGVGVGSLGGPIGATAGAVGGEIAGARLAKVIFSPSGAVQVGISPTELITLSPRQAMYPRTLRLLTQFTNAVKTGNAARLAGLYSAFENLQREPDASVQQKQK
jgi:hypothetical protein